MPWDLAPFADTGLNAGLIECLLGEHDNRVRPGLDRLWAYYRNPDRPTGAAGAVPGHAARGAQRLAQASGLPDRLHATYQQGRSKEIVVENDIGWRIDTLVDFLFGKPLRLASTASDEGLRRDIDAALHEAWERSGGIGLFQDMALLGAVYGSADLIVRWSRAESPRIELIEAPRGVALLDPCDYRRINAYIIVAPKLKTRVEPAGMFERVWRRVRSRSDAEPAAVTHRNATPIVEIISATHRQVYEGGRLVLDEPHSLGELPVAHIQNSSQPFRYEGMSDVEPLIPLQDELNTRLSDRAHRVTLQSFNMYLVKGLELAPAPGATTLSVAPGQVWTTDNTDAQVQAFGGDGHSPSEEHHINELREAMDKTSGVSPVVIGVVRERLGQLSSENALRLTLTGILSKTMRKRVTYGRGIQHASRLVLAALNSTGELRTRPDDRGVRLEWSDPLPSDERNRLSAALMKRDLGVPRERLLRELGYEPEIVPTPTGAGGAD